jgi:hypothetical protein
MELEGMELEESQGIFRPISDYRPRLDEPPPVRLLTVEDAWLTSPAGLERDLDAFYAGLLHFVREESGAGEIVYRSETFRLFFEVIETPAERVDYRPLRIEIPLLRDFEKALVERDWEYTRHKGLLPGQESITLLDPAGNFVEVSESRPV